MLNWKIEVRKVRKQEIPLKKCNELFVFYLSRAVFPRHIAHFTHPGPVDYIPRCGCHGNYHEVNRYSVVEKKRN